MTFHDVTEASLTNSTALYGAPSVSDDSLFFNLEGVGAFNIRKEDGGFDIVDGQLTTSLAAHSGYGIDSVAINEYGDYTLLGVGTSTTQVSVTVSAILRITEVNGVGVAPITTTLSDNATYDLASAGNTTGSWSLSVVFDAADILAAETDVLADAGITDGLVTQATLTFDNTIFAVSELTSGAFIAKKMVDIDVGTQPVPEPSALVLTCIGAVFFLGQTWRKRRSSQIVA
ncbi:MAG: PEP-CTERM sorting domain-containing protein [Thermoguttaceae bacterium]